MAEFVMLVGLPGSGKTTWAESQEGYEVYSSDGIREELGDVYDQTKNEKVFRILHKRIKEGLLCGKNCIFDATNVNAKKRRAFLDEIKGINCHKVARVFVRPFDSIREQNEKRTRVVPPEAIKKMLYRWQTPIIQEGLDEIVLDVQPCEWDFCDIEQDTKHHTLSLSEHMAVAARNASKFGGDKDVIATAAIHDIGKYWTKTFTDSKGYPTLEAHYFSHENVGAYLSLFGTGDDEIDKHILTISGLITWHMRPFVWDEHPNVREKDCKWMGDDLIKDLELLHRADVEAK